MRVEELAFSEAKGQRGAAGFSRDRYILGECVCLCVCMCSEQLCERLYYVHEVPFRSTLDILADGRVYPIELHQRVFLCGKREELFIGRR